MRTVPSASVVASGTKVARASKSVRTMMGAPSGAACPADSRSASAGASAAASGALLRRRLLGGIRPSVIGGRGIVATGRDGLALAGDETQRVGEHDGRTGVLRRQPGAEGLVERLDRIGELVGAERQDGLVDHDDRELGALDGLACGIGDGDVDLGRGAGLDGLGCRSDVDVERAARGADRQIEPSGRERGPRRRIGHRGAVVGGAFGDADHVDLDAHAGDVVVAECRPATTAALSATVKVCVRSMPLRAMVTSPSPSANGDDTRISAVAPGS